MLDLNRVCMVELDVYMNTRNITTTIATTQNIRNEKYKRIKFKHDDNEVRRRTKYVIILPEVKSKFLA